MLLESRSRSVAAPAIPTAALEEGKRRKQQDFARATRARLNDVHMPNEIDRRDREIIMASCDRRAAKLRALKQLEDMEDTLDSAGYLDRMILAVPALAQHRRFLRAMSPTRLFWCPRTPGAS